MANITLETRHMETMAGIILATTVNIAIALIKVIAAMEVIVKNTPHKDQ